MSTPIHESTHRVYYTEKLHYSTSRPPARSLSVYLFFLSFSRQLVYRPRNRPVEQVDSQDRIVSPRLARCFLETDVLRVWGLDDFIVHGDARSESIVGIILNILWEFADFEIRNVYIYF